jgi:hypothetical protein
MEVFSTLTGVIGVCIYKNSNCTLKVYLFLNVNYLKMSLKVYPLGFWGVGTILFFKEFEGWALVAHACNPSSSGSRDQEDNGSKTAWANSA